MLSLVTPSRSALQSEGDGFQTLSNDASPTPRSTTSSPGTRPVSTIDTLARQFGVHRATVMTHLERRCIPRRSPRQWTEEMVAGAAHRYAGGEALVQIAANLGFAPSTLTRELQSTGRRSSPPRPPCHRATEVRLEDDWSLGPPGGETSRGGRVAQGRRSPIRHRGQNTRSRVPLRGRSDPPPAGEGWWSSSSN